VFFGWLIPFHSANSSRILRKISFARASKIAILAKFRCDDNIFYKFCAKKSDTFRQEFTRYEAGEIFTAIFIIEVFYMNNRENTLEGRDLGLIVFVIVASWLLLFQSGLFR